MNQQQWVKCGEELLYTHASSQFSIGDWVLVGIATFGRTEAFDAAQEITGTGNTRNFYTRCAAVANYYKPELRFPSLPFSVYEQLRHWPISFLEKFIPEVAPSGRSCAQILHLAVEQFGSNPSPRKQQLKRHSVSLKASVYFAARERAKAENFKKVHFWIEQVLTDYLATSQSAGKASVPDSPGVGSDVEHAETQPEEGAEPESPRPDYATRRAQQIAAGAKPVSRKPAKPTKLRMLWTECHGESFKDTENGAVKFRAPSSGHPTKFFSEEDAIMAEAEFFKEKGYHERVVFCSTCSLQQLRKRQVWHVAHVFSSSPEARQQHAQA
jgi:hypothetical protein